MSEIICIITRSFVLLLTIFIVSLSSISLAQDNSAKKENQPERKEVINPEQSTDEKELILTQKATAEAQTAYYRLLTAKLDEKEKTKTIEILNALLPFTGLIIGSLITWLITKQTKRQEWRTEVNKQLIEKRISAYEEIIAVTKNVAIGGGETVDNTLIKYSLIVSINEYYSEWSLNFKIISTKYSHLIDSELSNQLTIFNNYLGYLDDYLGHWRTDDNEILNEDKLKKIGVILYEDIQKLTSNILEEAGRFYSKAIYDESFEPSTINRKEFKLPENFRDLALFSKRDDILQIIDDGN